jgi:hypothetical protein
MTSRRTFYRRKSRRSSDGKSEAVKTYGSKPTGSELNKEFNKKPKAKEVSSKPKLELRFVAVPEQEYSLEELRRLCKERIQASKSWKSFGHVPRRAPDGWILVRVTRKPEVGVEIEPMFHSRGGKWERI